MSLTPEGGDPPFLCFKKQSRRFLTRKRKKLRFNPVEFSAHFDRDDFWNDSSEKEEFFLWIKDFCLKFIDNLLIFSPNFRLY